MTSSAGAGTSPDDSTPDREPLDQIRLTGLRAKGFHGVFDHERRDGQDFVVDVVLHLDTRTAAGSDRLDDTVDYGALAAQLADEIRGEPVNLLERLAFRLADRCLADPRVQLVDVTVHKPQAPITEAFEDVAVTIRRHRVGSARSRDHTAGEAPARPDAVPAVIALGANLGDRLATLQSAVDALARTAGVQVRRASPVYETDPVGGPDQPEYLNAVVEVLTTLTPVALLDTCLRIEAEHGRTRETRWGARTLDLDLLTHGDAVLATPGLELPHPRAAGRGFVLVPWAAMDADAVIPGAGRVADLALLAEDRARVRARPDLALVVP